MNKTGRGEINEYLVSFFVFHLIDGGGVNNEKY